MSLSYAMSYSFGLSCSRAGALKTVIIGSTILAMLTQFAYTNQTRSHVMPATSTVSKGSVLSLAQNVPAASAQGQIQERTLLSESSRGQPCQQLSKELLNRYAKHNTILVGITDRVTGPIFGTSWVDNVKTAGITYWMVAALDPETSVYFGSELGVEQCFNAPSDTLRGKAASGNQGKYSWGSAHWTSTTWLKVHVMQAVYAHGFHIIHSDLDATWFQDPIDFFVQQFTGPAQLLTSTDMTSTNNQVGDEGLEANTQPHTAINTGVYFFRQCPDGMAFFEQWLSWQHKNVGHDQDGLNVVMRGRLSGHERQHLPEPVINPNVPRAYFGALSKTIAISFLPASMFANQYTYVNAQFHKLRNHTLYEVHWVWGGKTLESKRQSMRDATKFVDPPAYYSDPSLVSIEVDYPQLPEGFNSIPNGAVETMIQFHIRAVEHQLQQLYYGFAIAVALGRTTLLPRMLCFCSKNWYMTRSCRLDPDRTSKFPFTCSLSQVLRAKKLTNGYKVEGAKDGKTRVIEVREYSFLENRRTPDAIKASRLVVQPTVEGRGAAATLDQLRALVPPVAVPPGGADSVLSLPWPLTDLELAALLEPHQAVRVLHFVKPGRILGPSLAAQPGDPAVLEPRPAAPELRRRSFEDPALQLAFDKAMYAVTAFWCCRSPLDMKALNETALIDLDMVPHRQREVLLTNTGVARGHVYPIERGGRQLARHPKLSL